MKHYSKMIKFLNARENVFTPKYIGQYAAFSFGMGVVGGIMAFVPLALI